MVEVVEVAKVGEEEENVIEKLSESIIIIDMMRGTLIQEKEGNKKESKDSTMTNKFNIKMLKNRKMKNHIKEFSKTIQS